MLLFSLFLVVGLPVAVKLVLWVWESRADERSIAAVADIDNEATELKSEAMVVEEQKRQELKSKALQALQRAKDLKKDFLQLNHDVREHEKNVEEMVEKDEKLAAEVKEFCRGVDRFQTQLAIGLTAVVAQARSTGSFPDGNAMQRSTSSHSSTFAMTRPHPRLGRQRGIPSGRRGISSDYKRQ